MNFSINLNICRVCMKSKQCQQIANDSALNKKWFYTTRLQIDANDSLPKQLCENCIARLKISYDFVQAAHRSDKRLKAFLTKIHQDFDEVANTQKSLNDTNEDDFLEENDDFLSLLKPNKSNDSKSLEILFTNNSDCDNVDEDRDDEIKEDTTSKSKANQLSVLKSHLHHNSKDHGKFEISNALIKNEQDQLEGDTETESQEFEVAIDDEDYQFYDDSVHFVEGIEATNSINEASIATNSIDIEEIHIQEYDMQDETDANNETNSQNDEVSVRINAGEDGFLKEYDGSMSEGGNNETIDFIDEVSFQDLPNSEYHETDDSSKEIISEGPQFNMKFSTSNVVDEFKPKILKKNSNQNQSQNRPSSGTPKGSTARGGSKGRPSLPPNTRFLCVKCNRDFSTKTNLNRHLLTHEGVRPYKCKECFKSFSQNGTLKQHMLIHTGEKPYVCDFCNRGFNQSKSLIFHLRRHTGEKPFHCEFCSLDFRQKDGLKNHILRHHMGKSIGNKYLCIICKKVLNNKTELQMHMKKHVNNHRSMSSGALQTGEQNAEVILELINENNEYQQETTTIYSDEMSLSLSNVTSATHVVDITATSASEPSRAKKYQCCKCFKCFAIKKNLIRHLSIHEMTVSEMFQCHQCEIAFDTNYALNLHLVRTHKQVVENLNKCEECDIVFRTPGELNKHMDESHQHLCVECPNERFKSEKMLMEHMLEHELEDEEIMKLS